MLTLFIRPSDHSVSMSRVTTPLVCLDQSVLAENRPLVQFIHPGVEWRIFQYFLTSEDIDDVISHFYTVSSANILVVFIIKRK